MPERPSHRCRSSLATCSHSNSLFQHHCSLAGNFNFANSPVASASFTCGVPGKALQGVAGGEVTGANSRKNCANSCAMRGNGLTLQHTMDAKTHAKSWTCDILWPFMLFYGHFMPILWPRLMKRPHLACSRMTKCHTSSSCAPTYY